MSAINRTPATPWGNDWRGIAESAIHELGYTSFLEYSRNRQLETFEQLVAELAPGKIAPIQLFFLMKEEAASPTEVEFVARSSLVRFLRHSIPNGWRFDGNIRFEFTYECSSWIAHFTNHLREQARTIVLLLRSLPLPDTWCPQNIDDSIMTELFSRINFAK